MGLRLHHASQPQSALGLRWINGVSRCDAQEFEGTNLYAEIDGPGEDGEEIVIPFPYTACHS